MNQANLFDPGHTSLPAGPTMLHQGDAVEFLAKLPPESIDCVVTDPAYESLEKHRAKGTTTRLKHSDASSNDWFSIFPNSRFPELFAQLYRVMARNSHLYFYCDSETMFIAKPLGEAAGFKFWKPIVWDKQRIGMGYHYRSRCEFILFFERGKRKLNSLGTPDILDGADSPVINAARVLRGYPTEKPVSVSRVLIEQSTQPGEWVCDPFMGSGSVGEAAVVAGRKFAGNDLSAKSLEITKGRLISDDELGRIGF